MDKDKFSDVYGEPKAELDDKALGEEPKKLKMSLKWTGLVFLCYWFTMAFFIGLLGLEKAHFGSTVNALIYVILLPMFFDFSDYSKFKVKTVFLGLLAVIANAVAWYGVQQAFDINELQEVAEKIKTIQGWERAVAFLGTALLIPACEEIIFRKGLFKSLKSYMPLWAALLISSVLFSAIHFSLLYFVPLAILGFIFAYSYEKTKSLWVPILLHAFNNGMTLIDLWWDVF